MPGAMEHTHYIMKWPMHCFLPSVFNRTMSRSLIMQFHESYMSSASWKVKLW